MSRRGFRFSVLRFPLGVAVVAQAIAVVASGVSSNAVAQESATQTFQTTELDLPESTVGILLLLGGLVAVAGLTIRTSLRDSRFLSRSSQMCLLAPRLLVLGLLLVIVLNPQQRTQLSRVEQSRVAMVVDTSQSMQWPATDSTGNSTEPQRESRTDAIINRLVNSGLLSTLSKSHVVSVYTFDSGIAGPVATVHNDEVRFAEPSPGDPDSAPPAMKSTEPRSPDGAATTLNDAANAIRWRSLLQPRGSETRLGESLYSLIGQISGRSLSGLVVLSDGRSNAGLDGEQARLRAERTGTRVVAVGVGGLQPQPNLWIAGMQSPTDVHQGDPFEIRVMIQGTAAAGMPVLIRLFQQSSDGDGTDRRQIGEQSATATDEQVPVSVAFAHSLAVAGRYDFIAEVVAATGVEEMTLDDNQRRRTIEVTDRRMKVLVISSGPMRDYQFVRNTLFRHSGIESDVWLQTVTADSVDFVSQEARTLLTKFPATEAELATYDAIVAFDPDWSQLTSEQQSYLNRWVAEHAGGLVVVAGEIFTPRLAQDPDAARDISVLYPVLLTRMLPDMRLTQRADEPWPLTLTAEGRATEFLRILDSTGTASADLWQSFKGVYRSYPVRGVRDGAVVLLEYGNPRARTELGQPPFLASQIFGAGRTLFIGSAETWRLRELSSQGHQQFWTSLIREVAQGRRSRGSTRGQLMLDRTEVAPGQPVTIRAQLYDARLQPLAAESVPVTITDGEGQTVNVPETLNADSRGAGQFLSSFRPPRTGSYRISVPVPDSTDVLRAALDVVMPNLESLNPTQDVNVLTSLTRDTQGQYLSLNDVATLPSLLPDQSQPIVVDEQLKTLWDRSWLLYTMIALLAIEWILRRVLRLS